MLFPKLVLKFFLLFASLDLCLSDLEIDSLGHSYPLGYLYNARTGKFLSQSMFNLPLNDTYITTVDIGTTFSKAYFGLKYSEKVSHLQLSSEMSLSLATGIIDAQGAASFLSKVQEEQQEYGGTLIQIVRTVKKYILTNDIRLVPLISLAALNSVEATHVLVEADYAIRTVSNYKAIDGTNSSATSLEHNAKVTTGMLNAAIQAGGSWSSNLINRLKTFVWEFYSDFKFLGIPSSWDQVEQKMKEAAEKAETTNGLPVKYKLVPILVFEQKFTEPPKKRPEHKINTVVANDITNHIMLLHYVEDKLIKYKNAISAYFDVIPQSDLARVNFYIHLWILNMKYYMQSMVDTINLYRNGTVTLEFVQECLETLKDHYAPFSAYPVDFVLRQEFPDVDESIQRFKTFQSLGLNCLNTSVTINRLVTRRETFVVLYFRKSWIREDRKEWEHVLSIFTGYPEMWRWFNSPSKYMIDCDLWPHECEGITKFTFHKYDKGVLVGQADYLCDISKSFQKQTTESGYWCGLFRWQFWYIHGFDPDIGRECRTKRKLYRFCGSRTEKIIDIII